MQEMKGWEGTLITRPLDRVNIGKRGFSKLDSGLRSCTLTVYMLAFVYNGFAPLVAGVRLSK